MQNLPCKNDLLRHVLFITEGIIMKKKNGRVVYVMIVRIYRI